MNAHARKLIVGTSPLIEIDGQVEFTILRDVMDLRVWADSHGPRRLRLLLNASGTALTREDTGLLYQDGKLIDFGKTIKVFMGHHEDQILVFDGKISRIDLIVRQAQAAEIEVYAEDKLAELALSRRTKTYENVSDADLVREIAALHGLSTDITLEGPIYPLVQQWNESDLSFLTTRLVSIGADMWIENGKLHAVDQQERNPNTLEIHSGAEALSMRFRADLAEQRSHVSVGGYAMDDRSRIAEESSAQNMTSLTRDGHSGISILEDQFGERRAGPRLQAVSTAQEARVRARAAHRQRTRRFVCVNGIMTVLPQITIGTRLTFLGIGSLYGGSGYAVTAVEHTFDRSEGAHTLFSAERATLGRGQ